MSADRVDRSTGPMGHTSWRPAPEPRSRGDPQVSTTDPTTLLGQVRDLQAALASRPVIEQVKGVMMLRYRIDAETAFAVLTRVSQQTNTKVREGAALVCAAGSGHQRPDPDADSVLACMLALLAPTKPAAGTSDTENTTPAPTGRPPPFPTHAGAHRSGGLGSTASAPLGPRPAA